MPFGLNMIVHSVRKHLTCQNRKQEPAFKVQYGELSCTPAYETRLSHIQDNIREHNCARGILSQLASSF